MQLDIAAIDDSFPEGVWPEAPFRFLLRWLYLKVVFQDDDAFSRRESRLKTKPPLTIVLRRG